MLLFVVAMKIIKEVDTTGSGTINYREFLWMMLGGTNSILRL
jgi:Ca2+-binding EF-hand superfamily protein